MKILSYFILALSFFILPAFAEPTPSFAQSTLTAAEDTAITTYIYAKLASHPALSGINLDVSTHEGQVTFNGIINNPEQTKEIQQMAESTSGVKAVDTSNLIVSPGENALYVSSPAVNSTNPILVTPENPPQVQPVLAEQAHPMPQLLKKKLLASRHSLKKHGLQHRLALVKKRIHHLARLHHSKRKQLAHAHPKKKPIYAQVAHHKGKQAHRST